MSNKNGDDHAQPSKAEQSAYEGRPDNPAADTEASRRGPAAGAGPTQPGGGAVGGDPGLEGGGAESERD